MQEDLHKPEREQSGCIASGTDSGKGIKHIYKRNMQATGVPSTTIATVTVKLPPLWPANSALWFAHIDSLLATRSITRQETKFRYVANALQANEVGEVRDIV